LGERPDYKKADDYQKRDYQRGKPRQNLCQGKGAPHSGELGKTNIQLQGCEQENTDENVRVINIGGGGKKDGRAGKTDSGNIGRGPHSRTRSLSRPKIGGKRKNTSERTDPGLGARSTNQKNGSCGLPKGRGWRQSGQCRGEKGYFRR